MGWKLKEWTDISDNKKPMTPKEISLAIKYLWKNNYPKPEDCLSQQCQGFRPACDLGICYVATKLCGDF